MRIICVDDEELVLQLTVSLCRELPQKPDTEGFTSPKNALDSVKERPADIAILDINMPSMDGITLAAKIKESCPDCSIIFLTGYSEYAVDAFRLHASGYLLKPVSSERLLAEVEYALTRQKKPLLQSAHIAVQTFGEFDLIVDGKTVSFPRAKSKELLAYLVDRQGGSVTRPVLFAALWEEGIYDRAKQKYLDVIIRTLRDTLSEYGVSEILEMQRGSLRICPEKLDCDVYRFFSGDSEAVSAYRGEYMSAYSWANLTEAYMERVNRSK